MDFFISNNVQNDKLLCDIKKLPIEIEDEIINMFIMKMISLNPIIFKEELLLTFSINYNSFLKLTKTKKGRSHILCKLNIIHRILSHRLCRNDNFDDLFRIHFGFKPAFVVLKIIKNFDF